MFDWLQQHIWTITAVSVGVFIVTLVVGGWFVVRMPPDYFRHPERQSEWFTELPRLLRTALRWLRNLFGVVLILVGIVLSLPLVPGPGVVTILIGLSLTDFPGKHRLIRWLAGKRLVLSPLNWLRGKWGRPPLQPPVANPEETRS